MGDANRVRDFSRTHRLAFDLGPRTSGALLYDLYATAVAELAGEGRIHHHGIFTRYCDPLCREPRRIDFIANVANGRRHSFISSDCGLYCVPVRASKGARPLAESAV